MRRRSASAASMMRERASRRSDIWAVTAGSSFEPSSTLGVGAVEAAERAERGNPDPQRRARRAGRTAAPRARVSTSNEAERGPVDVPGDGPVPERQRDAPTPKPAPSWSTMNDSRPKRELQEQEGQVLPGGGVGEAGLEALPPAAARGAGGTGSAICVAGERADGAPLEPGQPAPGVDGGDQDRDADERDREAHADRQGRDEEGELDDAEHAGDQAGSRSARRCADRRGPC